MSLEQWSDERLDRLAETVEQSTANIQTLNHISQAQQETIEATRTGLHAFDERLDRLIEGTQAGFHAFDERLDRMAKTAEASTANIHKLLGIAQLQQENIEGTRAQFQQYIDHLQEIVRELRAGQERQERLLDYLIRRDAQHGDSL